MNMTSARCALLLAAVTPAAVTGASITGSATYRERITLPADAVFEATVEDTSRADAPAEVVGRVSFMPAGQVPIRFEIPYRESAIQPDHRYSVRARITEGGRLLYTSTQIHPVLTRGAGNRIDRMMLQRAADTAKRNRPLTNTYWKLTELRGAAAQASAKQREPHLILQHEGQRLAGSGGCNRLLGSYQIDGQKLAFGKVASTMMACHQGMEQEAAFVRALEETHSWRVEADRLELLDQSGTIIARFVAIDLK